MKRKLKQITSAILCIAMLCGMLPMVTQAADTAAVRTVAGYTYSRVTDAAAIRGDGKYLLVLAKNENEQFFMKPERRENGGRTGFALESVSCNGSDALMGAYQPYEWTLTAKDSGWLLGYSASAVKFGPENGDGAGVSLRTEGSVLQIGTEGDGHAFSGDGYCFNLDNANAMVSGWRDGPCKFYIYERGGRMSITTTTYNAASDVAGCAPEGDWALDSGKDWTSGAYQSDLVYLKSGGAKVTFTFTGSGIRIYGKSGSDAGIAKLTVDSETPITYDQYSGDTRYRARMLEKIWSENAAHTVTVEYTGEKNESSTGKLVAVDFFEVLESASAQPEEPYVPADPENPEQFMDCILPAPVVGSLSATCWGAADTGPRDQENGLEDKGTGTDGQHYCYWDGGILKDKSTGAYYMFASRWNEEWGHNRWGDSVAVYATSKNLYGPYVDQGLLWPDVEGGAGHNVFPLELKAGGEQVGGITAKYAIVLGDTNTNSLKGAIFVSESLAGPWKNIGQMQVAGGGTFGLSNICIVLTPEGKYLAYNRDGDIARADSIAGPWTVLRNNLWSKIPSLSGQRDVEDPVVWYSGGLYHCVVNRWDAKKAYYLTSEDGIHEWREHPGTAYVPSADLFSYATGEVNHWTKIERPNVYIEEGKVKAMTFSVIDVEKDAELGRDSHGSKVVVTPFSNTALERLTGYGNEIYGREGLSASEDAHVQSWQSESGTNYGGKDYLYLKNNTAKGAFGQESNPTSSSSNSDDCKIGYLKFDVSEHQSQKIEKAELSLVYRELIKGSPDMDKIRVALADGAWSESDVTWGKKPAITADLIVESGEFSLAQKGQVVTVDVTALVQKAISNGQSEITLALSETAGAQISIASKEYFDGYEPKLSITAGGALTPAETPTAAFDAATMVLTNVEAGMKYRINGGNWMKISGTSVDLADAGLTVGSIELYRPGDGQATGSSAIQTITLTKAAVPSGLTASHETAEGKNDGSITGVSDKMEYQVANSGWESIDGAKLTGLVPGKYRIRVKGADTVLASDSTYVKINAFGADDNKNVYPKVLIIGIDGAGSFAKNLSGVTEIKKIFGADSGILTYSAQAMYPTISGQNWGAMFTGSTPDEHKMNNSTTVFPNNLPYASYFKMVREEYPEANLASFASWDVCNNLYDPDVGVVAPNMGNSDAEVMRAAVAYLKEHIDDPRPMTVFVHLGNLDHIGHGESDYGDGGYGPTNPRFVEEFTVIDGSVKKLVDAVSKDSAIRDDTVVILNTDHGGIGKNHGGDTPVERNVMFGVAGKGFRTGEWTLSGSTENRDVAPLVAALIDAQPDPDWTGKNPLIKSVNDAGQTVLNVGDGDLVFGDSGVTQNGQIVTANEHGYELTGVSTMGSFVSVAGGTHAITLNNVRMQKDTSPFVLSSGANVTLTLKGSNQLKSTSTSDEGLSAALRVPTGATLTIEGTLEDSLTAISGNRAAGIGGNKKENAGTITINGGKITATAGKYYGAGIGGSQGGGATLITINGGYVTATGGTGGDQGKWGAGAGIGTGGDEGEATANITVTGGTVVATGGSAAGSPDGAAKQGVGLGDGKGTQGTWGRQTANVTITGGAVYPNYQDAATVYKKDESTTVHKTTLPFQRANTQCAVTVGEAAAFTGFTDGDGNLCIYLPNTDTSVIVQVVGGGNTGTFTVKNNVVESGTVTNPAKVHIATYTGKVPQLEGVTWDNVTADTFANPYETVTINGQWENGASVTAKVEVVPEGTVYFLDLGKSGESDAYNAVKTLLGNKLLNDKADQAFAESGWGHTASEYKIYQNNANASSDKGESGVYADNNANGYITYTLPLKAGEYTVTSYHKDWWRYESRPLDITAEYPGGSKVSTVNMKDLGTTSVSHSFVMTDDGILKYKIESNAAQAALVSWISVTKDGDIAVAPATYYVDSVNGEDTNNGTSPGTAWKTLNKVNQHTFIPGDKLLLKRGCVWAEETLILRGSGSAENPIVVNSYGDDGEESAIATYESEIRQTAEADEAQKPHIKANHKHEQAVLIENVEYWEVNNLQVSNDDPQNSGRTDVTEKRYGIVVSVNQFPGDAMDGIKVRNCYIHDCNGNLQKSDNEGNALYVRQVNSELNDLLIEGNHLENVNRNGISFSASGDVRSTGVRVRHNLLENIGGDGIKVWGLYAPLVEYNKVNGAMERAGGGDNKAAGIWPWDCDNATFQYNEVCNMKSTHDGQAFDIDYRTTNTIFQYNYSHDNEGGFMLLCSPSDSYSTGNVVRYNLSVNDGSPGTQDDRDTRKGAIFQFAGNTDTYIYNNTFYIGAGKAGYPVIQVGDWGESHNQYFCNNVFCIDTPNLSNFFELQSVDIGQRNYIFANNVVTGAGASAYADEMRSGLSVVEANSDEIFTDPASLTPAGFAPASGSPILSRGTQMTMVKDKMFDGRYHMSNSALTLIDKRYDFVNYNAGHDYSGKTLKVGPPDLGAIQNLNSAFVNIATYVGEIPEVTNVTWSNNVTAETFRIPYETVTIRGTKADGSTVTAKVEVIPQDTVYFLDMGKSGESDAYNAVKTLLGNKLLNDRADQAFAESGWGHTASEYKIYQNNANASIDKGESGVYANNSKGGYITYTLPLEAGQYTVTSYHHDWWKNGGRPMKITATYSGGSSIRSIDTNTTGTAVVTHAIVIPESGGALTYKIESTGDQAPLVSWISVQKGGDAFAERTSFSGVREDTWLDNNGIPIQAHGGEVRKFGDTYYWIGEDRSVRGWPGDGVRVYSSTDLLNWTDEGRVLHTMTGMGQFTDDEYFKTLYGALTAEEQAKIFDGIGPQAIIERPKMLYNEKTMQYVLWFHADGPTETSDENYAKASVGVAVSNSPTGPFKLVNVQRMNHVDGYYDASKGMARDMNVFVDDTDVDKNGVKDAYVIYSSEENKRMYVSLLNADYTGPATEGNVDSMTLEDGTTIKTFAARVLGDEENREAPAIFKYDGYYYMITSGTSGWDPNPARYHRAKSIFGPYESMGDPCVGSGADTTFRSQSTAVIPVDPENGLFIYMGDRWNKNHLQSSGYVWLPVEIMPDGGIKLTPHSDWDMDDLKALAPVQTDTAPMTVYLGEAMPDTIDVKLLGQTHSDTPVTWDSFATEQIGAFAASGTLTALNNRRVQVQVNVIPKNAVYFVDSGTDSATDYFDAVAAGNADTLKNETTPDQAYTQGAWGYKGDNTGVENGGAEDVYASLRYVNKANQNRLLEYSFALDAGSYKVSIGHFDPWAEYANGNRVANISVLNGETELAKAENIPISGSNTLTALNQVVLTEAGTLQVSIAPKNTGENSDVMVSFILITRTGDAPPIEDTDITDATVTAEGTHTYTGSAIEPAVSVVLDEETIPAGAYGVAFTDNTAAGTATITVTAKENSGYTGTATGTFTISPAALTGTPTISGDAVVGETLTVTYSIDAVTVQWYRGEDAIQDAVESSYVLTQDDLGETIKVVLTAAASGNYTGTVEATAGPVVAESVPADGVTLDKESLTLTVGGTATLTATASPENATNKGVTWSSSVPAVATVTDGVVTAVSAGTTTVTVTTVDGSHTDTCTVMVEAAPVVTHTITATAGDNGAISPVGAVEVTEGENQPFTITPDQGYEIANVLVDDVSVGAVTKYTFTNVTGDHTIAATFKAQTPGSIPVTGVTLDKGSLSLTVGETSTLIATVAPANASNKTLIWSSSVPTVATVTDGVVTAVSAGTTTVTVTTVDGNKSAACAVTVTAYVPPYVPPTGGGSSSTTTETEKNPDGSTTTTVTDKKTGTVTETTKKPDGTVTKVETKTDSSVTATETRKDGTKVESATTAKGETTAEVSVPKGKDKVTVTIPTPEKPAPGVVAVIVNPDGTEEVVRTSVSTEDGLRLTLAEGATLKLADNSKTFADVRENDWSAEAVGFVASRELFQGTGADAFSPALEMSRSMIMTVLYRLDGGSDSKTAGGAWYADAQAWAVEAGVSDGADPEENVTREQLALILFRYAKGTPMEADMSGFADKDAISPWATDAMSWAVNQGLITGKSGGRLDPTGTATRAEVAAILQRFLGLETE